MELIYINTRFLTQHRAGVQRFAFELCSGLYKTKQNIVFLSPQKIVPDYDLTFPVKKIGVFSGVIWEQIELPLYLFFKKNFILLNLCNTAPLLLRKKIVTIHDLSFIRFSGSYNFLYSFYYKLSVWFNIITALKVITVSETVREEIINYYKINPTKVFVVNNYLSDGWIIQPIQKELFSELEEKFNLLPGKYFLMVSMYNPLKNIEKVIELIESINGYKLVIIGQYSSTFNKKTSKYLSGLKSNKVILTGHIHNDNILKLFYKNAFCFITLSSYESFCIPILEAISLEVPVIASDVGAIRELFGDYPIFIKTENSKQILNDMHNIIQDIKSGFRKERVKLTQELKNKYSLKNSLDQLYKLI